MDDTEPSSELGVVRVHEADVLRYAWITRCPDDAKLGRAAFLIGL
jgi:hypothetical protein